MGNNNEKSEKMSLNYSMRENIDEHEKIMKLIKDEFVDLINEHFNSDVFKNDNTIDYSNFLEFRQSIEQKLQKFNVILEKRIQDLNLDKELFKYYNIIIQGMIFYKLSKLIDERKPLMKSILTQNFYQLIDNFEKNIQMIIHNIESMIGQGKDITFDQFLHFIIRDMINQFSDSFQSIMILISIKNVNTHEINVIKADNNIDKSDVRKSQKQQMKNLEKQQREVSHYIVDNPSIQQSREISDPDCKDDLETKQELEDLLGKLISQLYINFDGQIHSENTPNEYKQIDIDIFDFLMQTFSKFITNVQRLYAKATTFDFTNPDIKSNDLRKLIKDLIDILYKNSHDIIQICIQLIQNVSFYKLQTLYTFQTRDFDLLTPKNNSEIKLYNIQQNMQLMSKNNDSADTEVISNITYLTSKQIKVDEYQDMLLYKKFYPVLKVHVVSNHFKGISNSMLLENIDFTDVNLDSILQFQSGDDEVYDELLIKN